MHWWTSKNCMVEVCACLAIAAGYVVPFSLPPARGLRNDAKTLVFRMASCSVACGWSWLPLLARVQARFALLLKCACTVRRLTPVVSRIGHAGGAISSAAARPTPSGSAAGPCGAAGADSD